MKTRRLTSKYAEKYARNREIDKMLVLGKAIIGIALFVAVVTMSFK